MKVLSYPAYDQLEIADAPLPQLAAGEVLLRVAACGVCGSELESFKTHSVRRPPPLVMGHEFCGIIEDAGDASDFQTGQKVVANALVPCGDCVRCQRGDTHLCAHRQLFGMHRQGAFAEYVAVPARCLIPWPEELLAAAACLAEPLGNGVHMVNLTQHLPAERILIIGAGPIGLMAQQAFAALRGSQIMVADLSAERIAVAQKLGAAHIVNSREADAVALCLEWTHGEGADIVIDAVGAVATKTQSLTALRPGGAAVWIGLHSDEMTFNSYHVTLPEKQVFGSYSATLPEMQVALQLMQEGKVETASWVESFPLERGAEAFHRMADARGTDIKAVVAP